MNCTTCRYELSQCLDGRLPSGRRAIVMQHVETCRECGTFWTELQAAQQLTLQLPRTRVSEGFREQLWERIRAGEGTPDAVFREAIPMLTKVRYTLTGAAAAAIALLGVLWLQDGRRAGTNDQLVAVGPTNRGMRVSEPPAGPAVAATASNDMTPFEQSPLISSAQRLTFDVVALEAAKQLEQRHATATFALRRLEAGRGNHEAALRQVIENADEFRAFGELLLDLRERERVLFTDSAVDADLRVAINLLSQSQQQDPQRRRTIESVRAYVMPALDSPRLANVSRNISVVPALDAREEMDVLLHLNTQQPEVFPKLFIVFGRADAMAPDFGPFPGGPAFLLHDDCGPAWVAPRSEVEALDRRMRIRTRSHAGSPDIEVEIHHAAKKN